MCRCAILLMFAIVTNTKEILKNMNQTVNHQSQAERDGYEAARGANKYLAEQEAEYQQNLYDAAKEDAHKSKRRRDIIVKSVFTAFSALMGGKVADTMKSAAAAVCVAASNGIAWLGDHAYEWVIVMPWECLKGCLGCCCETMCTDPDTIRVNVNVNAQVNFYDRDTLKDQGTIEQATNDAKAVYYKETSEKIESLSNGEQTGLSGGKVATIQALCLAASTGCSFISSPESGAGLKVVSGVLCGGLTALLSAMPYIADKKNDQTLDELKAERSNSIRKQKINSNMLRQEMRGDNGDNITYLNAPAQTVNNQVLSPAMPVQHI